MFFSILLSGVGVDNLRLIELWGSRKDGLIYFLGVFSKSEGIEIEACETS
jgi:hypothetical protein